MKGLDENTGNVKWSIDTTAVVRGMFAIDDANTLYFGSEDSFITAVDVLTGDAKWRVAVAAAPEAISLAYDGLFATLYDNSVVLLN